MVFKFKIKLIFVHVLGFQGIMVISVSLRVNDLIESGKN